MPALSIVEHLAVFEDVPCRLVTSYVTPMVHELTRECPEEASEAGIVPAVAGVTHTRSDVMGGEQVLVSCRGRLGGFNRSTQHL